MKTTFKVILGTGLFFFIIAIILLMWYEPLQALRLSFGAAYVLFLPGFIWSFIFFRNEPNFNGIERFTYSFTLSITLVTIGAFFANALGMKINLWNSLWLILGISIAGVLFNGFLKVKRHA